MRSAAHFIYFLGSLPRSHRAPLGKLYAEKRCSLQIFDLALVARHWNGDLRAAGLLTRIVSRSSRLEPLELFILLQTCSTKMFLMPFANASGWPPAKSCGATCASSATLIEELMLKELITANNLVFRYLNEAPLPYEAALGEIIAVPSIASASSLLYDSPPPSALHQNAMLNFGCSSPNVSPLLSPLLSPTLTIDSCCSSSNSGGSSGLISGASSSAGDSPIASPSTSSASQLLIADGGSGGGGGCGVYDETRPHQCSTCGKRFRFKSNLFEHKTLHQPTTPYFCPFCSKACRLKGNLKKHLQTHVGTEALEVLWKSKFSRSAGRPRKHTLVRPLPQIS